MRAIDVDAYSGFRGFGDGRRYLGIDEHRLMNGWMDG